MDSKAVQGLTVKQRAFVDAYVRTHGNAAEAARQAGYRAKNSDVFSAIGCENLGNPKIKAAIDAKFKAIEEEMKGQVATPAEVMLYLTKTMRGEIKEEVICVVGTGDGIAEVRHEWKQCSAHERTDAAKTLARILGMEGRSIAEVKGGSGATVTIRWKDPDKDGDGDG
nr:MAG TPA: Terminase small subunit [Caudoviricetes sp.]